MADREADGFSNRIYRYNWVALKPHFGHLHPGAIKPDDCRAYARMRFDAGIAPATVHTELIRLRHCFRWAEDNLLIDRVPKIWTPSRGPGRKVTLSRPEAVALMDAAKRGDPHIGVFTAILFCTGARHHAITELAWDRVDFAANTIDFAVDGVRDPMSKAYKKGRAKVLMSRVCRAILMKAYLGRQTDWVIEHGGRRVKDCRGGFAAAVKRAGIVKKVTPHTIRHTVVTWLQERSDVQTRHAAQLVGHADERTTSTVYTHMGPEALQGVVDVLDGVFGALPTSPGEADETERSEELFRSIASRLGRAALGGKDGA